MTGDEWTIKIANQRQERADGTVKGETQQGGLNTQACHGAVLRREMEKGVTHPKWSDISSFVIRRMLPRNKIVRRMLRQREESVVGDG